MPDREDPTRMAPNVADKLSKAKEDMKTGLKAMVYGNNPEQLREQTAKMKASEAQEHRDVGEHLRDAGKPAAGESREEGSMIGGKLWEAKESLKSSLGMCGGEEPGREPSAGEKAPKKAEEWTGFTKDSAKETAEQAKAKAEEGSSYIGAKLSGLGESLKQSLGTGSEKAQEAAQDVREQTKETTQGAKEAAKGYTEHVGEATTRAKDAAVTGLKKVVGAGGDEDKDEPKASWLENPLANKGADIEKAAIESNAPTKPTEVSKDKEGNIRRSLGKSGAAEHEPKPKY